MPLLIRLASSQSASSRVGGVGISRLGLARSEYGERVYFSVTKELLQPLPLVLILMGLALAYAWRKRREGRGLILVGITYGALVLMTVPAVIYPLVGTLEWRFPPLTTIPEDAEAIVVLSGGIYEPDRTRTQAILMEDTLYRCLCAADLYRQGKTRLVIVTGGVLNPTSDIPPVAPAMRDLLVELGARPSEVIVEATASTTHENGIEVRKIIEKEGIRKIVLVTDAVHMYRALAIFRKLGIDAVPAPCHHRSTQFKFRLRTFVPSPRAIEDLMAVAHEWLGIIWYVATRKI